MKKKERILNEKSKIYSILLLWEQSVPLIKSERHLHPVDVQYPLFV